MWAKLDEVFTGPALNLLETRMREISDRLIANAFDGNLFINKIESFIRDSLKKVIKLVPIEKLLEFVRESKGMVDGFLGTARNLIDTVSDIANGGSRALFPLLMDLIKPLVQNPVLKEAHSKIQLGAEAMQQVHEGTTAILDHGQTLIEVAELLESIVEQGPAGAAVTELAKEVSAKDENGGSESLQPVDLYMQILDQLQPHLEAMIENIFTVMRSSGFAAPMIEHAEAGLAVPRKVCEYAEPLKDFHTQYNQFHEIVHRNSIIHNAKYYMTFFVGEDIFNFLGFIDEKITDGCKMVTTLADKYDQFRGAMDQISNFVKTASSFGENIIKKITAIPPVKQVTGGLPSGKVSRRKLNKLDYPEKLIDSTLLTLDQKLSRLPKMTFADGFMEDFDILSKTVLQLSKSAAGQAGPPQDGACGSIGPVRESILPKSVSVDTGVGLVEAKLKARALEAIKSIEKGYQDFLENATVIVNSLGGGFDDLSSDIPYDILFAAVDTMKELTGKADMVTGFIADVSMCALGIRLT